MNLGTIQVFVSSSNSNPSLFMNDFLITTDNKYIALSVAMKFPQYFLQAHAHVFNILHFFVYYIAITIGLLIWRQV